MSRSLTNRSFFCRGLLTLGVALIISGGATRCASPAPIETYTLARSALQAAKSAEAAQYASQPFLLAEEFYRKGEAAYKERDFERAKTFLEKAKEQAERAENMARLKKFKSGDMGQ